MPRKIATGKLTLGIDIGGTKIAGGLLNARGRMVAADVVPTLAEKGKDVSLRQVMRIIERLIKKAGGKGNLYGIGICSPGPLNPKTGIVLTTPNLPGWQNIPLSEMVIDRFGLPTRVDNDANAAGLAEVLIGAAVGYADVFYVTISTGIGTGIILDKKIYHGKNGVAAEGGHFPIDPRSEYICGCGNRGCIEALCSGPSMSRRARVMLEQDFKRPSLLRTMTGGDLSKITSKTISEAAAKRDPVAQFIVDETGFYLGAWFGGIVSLLDPDMIVIGGGVAHIGEPLFRKIRETIPQYTINRHVLPTLPIVRAKLRENVGVFGAASLLLDLV
jgi:glucokinase